MLRLVFFWGGGGEVEFILSQDSFNRMQEIVTYITAEVANTALFSMNSTLVWRL